MKIIRYLKATGDFSQEAARLELWYNFLKKTDYPVNEYYSTCIKSSRRFCDYAERIFSDYTGAVPDFLKQRESYYTDREDILFCTRPQAEYHLNIVCAEILNRAFRKKFDGALKKIVLLPLCMRNPGTECKASGGKEKKCRCCDPGCRICRITELCSRLGVETRLIPHSSDFSDTLRIWQNDSSTALVGIACILNLLRGGYEMRKLGIPSQCVFLDWCGCRGHWTESGIPTDINPERLVQILTSGSTG